MTEDWPHGGSLEEIAMRARLLIAMADGYEEAGILLTARRMRVVARDALELVNRAHTLEFSAANNGLTMDKAPRNTPTEGAPVLP